MKCFYHRERDAVALCKACNRGVCHECAMDVPPSTACKSRCEGEVAALNLVMERGKTAYQKTGKAYRLVSIVALLIGGLFTILGLLPILLGQGYGAIIAAPIGAIFMFYGYALRRNAKQIESIDSNEKRIT